CNHPQAGIHDVVHRPSKAQLYLLEENKIRHHWIEGNLTSSARCVVCTKNCSTENSLSGFRCGCWWLQCPFGLYRSVGGERG
ncbi:hypothetical protein GBAR_LOCUS2788, partial [Geodia barretti]